jgi:hypothetical protein
MISFDADIQNSYRFSKKLLKKRNDVEIKKPMRLPDIRICDDIMGEATPAPSIGN